MKNFDDYSKIFTGLSRWRDNTFPPSKNTFDWKTNELHSDIHTHNTLNQSMLKDILLQTTPIITQQCDSTEHYEISLNSEFPKFNPSIIKTAAGFVLSLRESNFIVKGDNQTFQSATNRHTNYHILLLDESLEILESKILDVSCIKNKNHSLNCGIEDIRLFNWNDKIYGIGAAVNHYANDVIVRQILFELIDFKISEYFILPSPSDLKIEKNWIPLVRDGDLFLVYSLMPLIIYKFVLGQIIPFKGENNTINNFEIRGGTPLICCGCQFIGAVHLSTFSTRNKRYGRHLFIALDEDLDLKLISEPFFIRRKGIEYACGLQKYNEKIYLSYGVGDNRSCISIFDKNELFEFLNWW